eukprot:TRINITY_DN11925_c0_g1_i1.p1 TRINITY_DN11925_c0_g1~~TRINITY_DN11925_c0_g1_i1.p1  ORF type:complete len:327 (+),score=47.97 TRINITY_DN11925_c0_g1_i1:23-982(+)
MSATYNCSSNITANGIPCVEISVGAVLALFSISVVLWAIMVIWCSIQIARIRLYQDQSTPQQWFHILVLCSGCLRVLSYAMRIGLVVTGRDFSIYFDLVLNCIDDISLCFTLMSGCTIIVIWATAFYIAKSRNVAEAVASSGRLRLFGLVLSAIILFQFILVDGILRFALANDKLEIDQISDYLYLALCLIFCLSFALHGLRLRSMLAAYPNRDRTAKAQAVRKVTIGTVGMVIAIPLHALVYIVATQTLGEQIFSVQKYGILTVVLIVQDVLLQWLPCVVVMWAMSAVHDMRRTSRPSMAALETAIDFEPIDLQQTML